MKNPYDVLKTKKASEEFEEVGGAFTCQEQGCWDTVYEAKFFTKTSTLAWQCSNEHISKIKDFVF